jgi:hypothetical protein
MASFKCTERTGTVHPLPRAGTTLSNKAKQLERMAPSVSYRG